METNGSATLPLALALGRALRKFEPNVTPKPEAPRAYLIRLQLDRPALSGGLPIGPLFFTPITAEKELFIYRPPGGSPI